MIPPEDMARIHARCFTRPAPWRAQDFAALLDDPKTFALTQGQAFAIGRVILDEAELLTIATPPEVRRQGLGRALLARFAATARCRGAVTAFLEVASDNIPAQALYKQGGWQPAGRRKNYYGNRIDALLLTLTLTKSQESG